MVEEPLEKLLRHWITHLKEHSEKIKYWSNKANAPSNKEFRELLVKASEAAEEASKYLKKALEKLK